MTIRNAILCGLAILVAAVLVGGQVLFGWATPILAPVLPRPEIVPKSAAAHSDWKNSGGTGWDWCEGTPSGRVQWRAFSKKPDVGLSLAAGKPCPPGGVPEYGDRADVILGNTGPGLIFRAAPRPPSEGRRMGGEPCRFTVSPERMGRYLQVAREARAVVHHPLQDRLLAALAHELERTDGAALTASADGSSCSNGPRF